MSADNGIYILVTPSERFSQSPVPISPHGVKNGWEYRVIHAQAIDNIWYDGTDYSDEVNAEELCHFFEDCEVIASKEDAWKKAMQLYDGVMKSAFPILEYGVSEIRLPNSFKWYQEQAK